MTIRYVLLKNSSLQLQDWNGAGTHPDVYAKEGANSTNARDLISGNLCHLDPKNLDKSTIDLLCIFGSHGDIDKKGNILQWNGFDVNTSAFIKWFKDNRIKINVLVMDFCFSFLTAPQFIDILTPKGFILGSPVTHNTRISDNIVSLLSDHNESRSGSDLVRAELNNRFTTIEEFKRDGFPTACTYALYSQEAKRYVVLDQGSIGLGMDPGDASDNPIAFRKMQSWGNSISAKISTHANLQGDFDNLFKGVQQKIGRENWTKDSHGSCELCNAKVGFMTRHHCRLCGKLICNNCSRFAYLKTKVRAEKVVNARVCKDCHEKIA